MDGFIRVFDSENSPTIELRKITNKAMGDSARTLYRSNFQQEIGIMCQETTAFLEKKAKFIWNKMQDVIDATGIDYYPELNKDLKARFADYFNPTQTFFWSL